MTKQLKNRIKREYQGYLWILPAFALLFTFSYYPALSAFCYSMTNWDGASLMEWQAFQNFASLFRDMVFYKSVGNMLLLLAAGLVAGNLMTIFLAELLFNLRSSRMSKIYRYLFILPILVPGIVFMLLWQRVILSPNANGLMNRILSLFGAERSLWYYGESTVLLSIFITGFPWVGGTSFLIYLAGLQNIPDSVLEAGKLDGITVFKRILYIDLPLIKSQLKYFLVLGIIGGIQNYGLQYLITKGGPSNNASMVPGYYMFQKAFNHSEFGYACAIGVVLFFAILAITIINLKFVKGNEEF